MIGKFVLAGALASAASLAQAQEVRVGVNLPYTGVGAELAQQIDRGMEQYLKLNPVKGYKVTLVKRDVKDPERRQCPHRGPGAADPGQGRRAGRLGLFAERHRGGAGRERRQEARRDHERRHRAHHADVELLRAHLVQHVARRLRHGRGRRQAPQGQDRGGRLHRLPARQGHARVVQARLRGVGRQGDRRDPDGRPGRGAGLHAVLPARQGQEAGRVLRLRSGRRPCRRRWCAPTARSACARPASS